MHTYIQVDLLAYTASDQNLDARQWRFQSGQVTQVGDTRGMR